MPEYYTIQCWASPLMWRNLGYQGPGIKYIQINLCGIQWQFEIVRKLNVFSQNYVLFCHRMCPYPLTEQCISLKNLHIILYLDTYHIRVLYFSQCYHCFTLRQLTVHQLEQQSLTWSELFYYFQSCWVPIIDSIIDLLSCNEKQ